MAGSSSSTSSGLVDPVVSAETDRFEQARDPSHTRLLPDQDIRFFLDANELEVLTNEITREQRNLERYLDLVGLTGDERRRVSGMAPGAVYEVEIGWYVARKRGGLHACAQLRSRRSGSPASREARDRGPGRGLRDRDEPVGKPGHDHLGLALFDRLHDSLGDVAQARSRSAGTRRLARTLVCGKPSVSTNPGMIVWTSIPVPRSAAASERENASWACFDAEYGAAGVNDGRPPIETMFTT